MLFIFGAKPYATASIKYKCVILLTSQICFLVFYLKEAAKLLETYSLKRMTGPQFT